MSAFALLSAPCAVRRTQKVHATASKPPSAVRAASRPARKVRAEAANVDSETAITGMMFDDTRFSDIEAVPRTQEESLARQHYHPSCEAALNDQINTPNGPIVVLPPCCTNRESLYDMEIEYNVSYIYHSLFAYFDQDNVALPGLAQYFKDGSVEEREHAEMMMEYQNLRGGKVKLQSIIMPDMDLGHAEQGDALYAMELALSLERLNNEKLLALHKVAEECDDPQMTDYVEGTFLADQVDAIKRVSEYVSQLRRVGPGHGTYQWDRDLLAGLQAAAAAAA